MMRHDSNGMVSPHSRGDRMAELFGTTGLFKTAGALLIAGLMIGCTGGAAGDPDDDIGDIIVITTSPGNGDQVDLEDSNNGFNALDRDDLVTKDSVTVQFSNSLDPASVINPDPSDPQGTRNIRLFYFDLNQGPFDPDIPTVPGVNPPGANVLVEADSTLTQIGSVPNNAIVITPTGISAGTPMAEGQYSVIVSPGVRGADGDGMKGDSYFFYYRVGQDNLAPTIVTTLPTNNQTDVAPDAEIRITMSETILASSVTTNSIQVSYTPAGSTTATPIPGTWFTDGGNSPGNNFPNLQLDARGTPGFSGVSERNGADLVFFPDLDQFPVNFAAFDPFDFFCPFVDPPRKGNQGFPRGQAITVTFATQGSQVSDTAGNSVPLNAPNTSFKFFTEPLTVPVYAPDTAGAVYFGDTFGVGVIDINSARTRYLVGPNPSRPPDSVVREGGSIDPNAKVVRVPIVDLVDMTTDTRPYTAFYSMLCGLPPPPPLTLNMGNVFVASGSRGGGEIVVVDAYRMVPLGTFNTPSPGGVAVTANGTGNSSGRLAVSNFSANTVTIFDISKVMWFKDEQGALPAYWTTLANNVNSGQAKLILNEEDFTEAFPIQKAALTSPPGPPVLGTINTGVGPTAIQITGLPNSLGVFALPPCPSPFFFATTIVCNANSGESTVDFTEITNLSPEGAINPDLRGVNVSSAVTDVTYAPTSLALRTTYFFIAGIGGTVELFATGSFGGEPSVRAASSTNTAPNKIINNVGGLIQPSAVQWITNGFGSAVNFGYTAAVLVAETGENRLQQLGVVTEFPNLFQVSNANHSAGLGPVDITGDPVPIGGFGIGCAPGFSTYYVANAGEGNVTSSDYRGAVLGAKIPVPGVLLVASWWSR